MLKKFRFYMSSIGTIVILLLGITVSAAPACPMPFEFTQPNGDIITITGYGDEFFSWQEDENGNIITYDEESNSYKYADIKDNEIVPTSQNVGEISLFSLFSHKIQRADIEPLWENAERVDYSKPAENDSIQLMSADNETAPQKPLTDQKLLTILIEFKDMPIKFGVGYWYDKMYDTTSGVHSVVNYWKENSNGRDIFKPAVINGIKKGDKGTVSNEKYTDIRYEIKECRDGIVRVYLDMSHPVKKWSMSESSKVNRTTNLAIRAIEKGFDFKAERPHLVTILSGYDGSYGEGEGQITAYTQVGGMSITDGTVITCIYLGEKLYDNVPTGIGTICHELGHSVFFLPDLYPSIFQHSNGGINEYSLMSTGCLANRDYSNISDDEYATPYDSRFGHMPTHLDPWSKIKCGFVAPMIVNDWDGDINSILPDGETSKYNVLKIISKTDPTQYFLVENRQLIGFDRGLECIPYSSGGIIIWHIDENVDFNNNNDSKHHHFMQVEPSNNCSPFDLSISGWRYTNEAECNKFNAETVPNSNLHERKTDLNYECSYGEDCHPQTRPSGVSIEVVGENGTSIRVKAKVDDEYVIDFANKKFSELFPDENVCDAFLDIVEKKSGVRKTPDSIISAEDAVIIMSISDLDLNDRGVNDLSGIEQLPILEWLRLERNELTNIDTSKFPNLIALFCNDNKIKELDVSNMDNLMYFDCSNNLLTNINVSKNTNLIYLWCSGNELTELNTNSNGELYELYCFDNKLTKLDVRNNKDLETVQCYDNYMGQNPETAIVGLSEILPLIGTASTKDDENENYSFIYYPQKHIEEISTPSPTPTTELSPTPTAEPSPTPTAEPSPTPTAEPSPTPTAEPSPTPTPKTGDRIEFEQTDDKVTAKLIFDNIALPAENDIWLIVAYRENGQLKRIEIPEISDMTTEFNYQDCDIIVYVWDKDMKPLMEVQKFKKQ